MLILFTALLILYVLYLHSLSTKLSFVPVQKISYAIVSFLSIIGFISVLIFAFASINIAGFRAGLEHYLIGKFSEPNAIIGVMTLQNYNGDLVVYPENKQQKTVAVYQNGKLFTANYTNGAIVPIPDTQSALSIWNLFNPY